MLMFQKHLGCAALPISKRGSLIDPVTLAHAFIVTQSFDFFYHLLFSHMNLPMCSGEGGGSINLFHHNQKFGHGCKKSDLKNPL